MIIQGFVGLTPVDVDDIHSFVGDFSNLKISLIYIQQVGITGFEVSCNPLPPSLRIQVQVESGNVVLIRLVILIQPCLLKTDHFYLERNQCFDVLKVLL